MAKRYFVFDDRYYEGVFDGIVKDKILARVPLSQEAVASSLEETSAHFAKLSKEIGCLAQQVAQGNLEAILSDTEPDGVGELVFFFAPGSDVEKIFDEFTEVGIDEISEEAFSAYYGEIKAKANEAWNKLPAEERAIAGAHMGFLDVSVPAEQLYVQGRDLPPEECERIRRSILGRLTEEDLEALFKSENPFLT